jgi:CRISPR type I-E-associated protein CasB/Cse2
MSTVLQELVSTRIGRLQSGYLNNRSAEVAALARLRRGLGKKPGAVLDILEYTSAAELVHDLRDDDPTFAEIAAHHCLTLFAMHQQSLSRRMHQTGSRPGMAFRQLVGKDGVKPENPVVRRFTMLGTADSLDELAHHLRGMVQLLRAKAIPLDYGRLAGNLLSWQYPGGADRVRLSWGRDFYTNATTDEN